MTTMTLSQMQTHIEALMREHGDVGLVLWDYASGDYFTLTERNFEAQLLYDGSVRVSVGPNSDQDPHEPEPAKRPV